jgi:hypothetical protein
VPVIWWCLGVLSGVLLSIWLPGRRPDRRRGPTQLTELPSASATAQVAGETSTRTTAPGSSPPDAAVPAAVAPPPPSNGTTGYAAFVPGNYRTTPEEFPLKLVDVIFNKSPLPSPVTAAAIGAVAFLGGALASAPIGFFTAYWSTPAIWLGTLGIAWVSFFLRHGSHEIHDIYAEIRPCFLVSDTTYKTTLSKWFSRMSRTKWNVVSSVLFALVAWSMVYIAFVNLEARNNSFFSDRVGVIFGPSWHATENLLWKSGIIAWYAFWVAFPLGTSTFLLIGNALFLFSLGRWPIVPVAAIVRSRFRVAANFYFKVAASWMFGVFLFARLLLKADDVVSLSFVLSLFVIGCVTFIVPQFVFRSYLFRSYRTACDISLLAISKRMGIYISEVDRGDIDKPLVSLRDKNVAELSDLSSIVQATAAPKMWIYDQDDVVFLLFTVVLAFFGIFQDDVRRVIQGVGGAVQQVFFQ